jgi:PAS domain S-box-containing protein
VKPYLVAPIGRANAWLTTLGAAGAIAIVYYFAARLGLAMRARPSGVAVFWPASGIAAGILIMAGRRAGLAVVIGVIAGTVTANIASDRTLLTAILKGLCNAGEPFVMAWLLQRWFGRPFSFCSLPRVLGFLAAAGPATATSAIGGAAIMTVFHTPAPFWDAWRTWFLSDAVGIVAVAPLLIDSAQLRDPIPRREMIAAAGVLSLLILFSTHIMSQPGGSWLTYIPATGVLSLTLWLAARSRPVFAVAGAFVGCMAIIINVILGIGRFGDATMPVAVRVNGAQAVIVMVTMGTLVLAALFAEMRTRELTLAKSEAKLAGILRIAGDAIISIDARHRIAIFNEAAEEVFGYARGEVLGQPIDLLIPARYHAAHRQHISRFASGADKSRRMAIQQGVVGRRKNGEEFPVEASIAKLTVDGECYYAVVLRDITERRQAEEHRSLLVAELDHRVKNTLATVSAVVSQTLEGRSSMADFAAALDARIRAMATTHQLLSANCWQGVSLAELVTRELAPYVMGKNAEIDGPMVLLRREAAQAMGMVLHELTTNAAKYGALSSKDGCVSVRWKWRANGQLRSHLVLDWREIGGPPVVATGKTSYGTRTIRDLIPYELSGTVELEFAREGVRCRVELPAGWLSDSSDPVSEAVKGVFDTSVQQPPHRQTRV